MTKNVLGFDMEKQTTLIKIVPNIYNNITDTHIPTAITAGVSLVILIALYTFKKTKKLPNYLFIVIIALIVFWASRWDEKFDIKTIGDVPSSLPSHITIDFNLELMKELALDAVMISIIGYIESASVTKEMALNHMYKINQNRELGVLGIGNIIGAWFGCFPTMGSFSRTAINNNTGAKSQISLFVSSLLVLVCIVSIGRVFEVLPKPVLGGIVIVAVGKLMDIRFIINIYRIDKLDFLVTIVSLFGTTLLGIDIGILVTIVLSFALYIYRNAKTKVTILGNVDNTSLYRDVSAPNVSQYKKVKILQFNSPLFFASAPIFERKILCYNIPDIKYIVLDFSAVTLIDVTALQMLKNLIVILKEHNGIKLYFTNISKGVFEKLKRSGIREQLGKDKFLNCVNDAIINITLRERFNVV